jgi:hypothetical protein
MELVPHPISVALIATPMLDGRIYGMDRWLTILEYDSCACRRNRLAGHFELYRNTFG